MGNDYTGANFSDFPEELAEQPLDNGSPRQDLKSNHDDFLRQHFEIDIPLDDFFYACRVLEELESAFNDR